MHKRKRTRNGHSMVEFALCMFAVFLSIFGLINLVLISASIAGAYFITTYSAIQAATQTNYDSALASATANCNQLMKSGFATWVKMQPVGGFAGSGMNLYVEERDTTDSTSRTVGPNTPVPAPIDTTKKVYEFTADCTYEVGPFVNMSAFPGLNQIPFLGRAARLHCSASRAAEHPEGLTGYGTLTSLSKTFNGLPAGFEIDDSGFAHWTNPKDSTTQPGSGISYVLVPDRDGAGAYLLAVSLDSFSTENPRDQNINFVVQFKGVHLTASTTGMVNQLESFSALDATGHATSYTVDPGQEIGIRNLLTLNGNLQDAVKNLKYTQGAGYLPAVETGWNHFSNWYAQQANNQPAIATNTTSAPTAIAITSPGRIADTPVPTFGNNSSETVSQPLNNNSTNTDYGTPTVVSATAIGVAPARFAP